MVIQSAFHYSAKKLSAPADVIEEVIPMPTGSSDGASETTGTALQVTKIDVAQYHHENVLPKVNQINEPDIALHDISDAHILSFVQFFLAYGSDHTGKQFLSRPPPR